MLHIFKEKLDGMMDTQMDTEGAVGVNGHRTQLELEVRSRAGDLACGGEVGPISKVRPIVSAHRNDTVPIAAVFVCSLIELDQAGEPFGILALSGPGLLNNKRIIVKSSCDYQVTKQVPDFLF